MATTARTTGVECEDDSLDGGVLNDIGAGDKEGTGEAILNGVTATKSTGSDGSEGVDRASKVRKR